MAFMASTRAEPRLAEEFIVAGFRGEEEGATFDEVAFDERAFGHFAGGLIGGDFLEGGGVAVGGVAEEDDSEDGHAVFGGGEL